MGRLVTAACIGSYEYKQDAFSTFLIHQTLNFELFFERQICPEISLEYSNFIPLRQRRNPLRITVYN